LRIYQAAQHLGVTSKDLLDLLKDQGVDVKSPSSTVDDATFLMAERLLDAAAAAPPPPAEPARSKPAEPAPIPTKAGRVGSIPAAQKGKGKGDADEHPSMGSATAVAEPELTSPETEVQVEEAPEPELAAPPSPPEAPPE